MDATDTLESSVAVNMAADVRTGRGGSWTAIWLLIVEESSSAGSSAAVAGSGEPSFSARKVWLDDGGEDEDDFGCFLCSWATCSKCCSPSESEEEAPST